MSTVNGQPVDAPTLNAAYASRTSNTTIAGVTDFTNTTDATSELNGAVHVVGGLGVEKNVFAGISLNAPTVNADDVSSQDVSTDTLNAGVSVTTVGLTVSGTANITDLNVSGTFAPTNVNVTQDVIIGDDLTVTGDTTLAGVDATTIDTTGDVVIGGNLTVNGTTTTVNSTTLEVTDSNVVVNNGGNDTTAQGAGLTVERTTVNGAIEYDSTTTSKFKIGNVGSLKEIATISDSQELINKTYVQPQIKEESTTPSNPSTNYWKLYPKSDGHYELDDAGAETKIRREASISANGIVSLGNQILGDGSKVTSDMFGGSTFVDSATTGTDQMISSLKTLVKLTNASLVSVDRIDLPASFSHSFLKYISNNTGSSFTIKHNSGTPSSKRIFTSDGNNLTVPDGTTLSLLYDTDTQVWRVVGSISTGGSSTKSVARYETVSGQAVSSATKVNFGDLIYDPDSIVSNASSNFEINCNKNGYITVNSSLFIQGASDALGTSYNIELFKNGSFHAYIGFEDPWTTTAYNKFIQGTPVRFACTNTDVFDVRLTTNNGTRNIRTDLGSWIEITIE